MDGSIRVLHVDDEPDVAAAVARFLQREDDRLVVDTAGGVDDALGRVGEYECVVSDYDMTGRNGLEFLEAVREDYPDLPFILYTGRGSEQVASKAISAGVTDYLRKGPGAEQYELLANRITNAVERYRAQRQLEQKRKWSELMFERFTQPAVEVRFVDGSTVVERVNEAFEETFGYDAEEIVGEPLNEFVVPEDRRAAASRLDDRIQRGEFPVSEEVTRLTADGERTFLFQAVVYDHDSRGFGIYTDISEQKQRQQRLQRETERYRTLFENTSDAVAWVEYEGDTPIIREANPVFRDLFEPEGADVVGQPLDDAVAADHRREDAERISERVHAGETMSAEIVRDTVDGERTFLWQAVPMTDVDPDSETVEYAYAVYTDVTELREREEELAESRERYRSLFENNPLVLWEEDFSAGKEYVDSLAERVDDLEAYLADNPEEVEELLSTVEVIDVNRNALAYYGADSKAELMANLDQLVTDESIEATASMWAAVAAGETQFRAETVSRTLDGQRRHEILQMYVPEAYADDYSRVYITGTDITERKRREQELQRQNDRLDEFAGLVSHDLRNPLQVANGSLALAREECNSPHLDAVAEAHDRMDELIDDVLTLARQGETVSQPQPVDLRSAVDASWSNVDTGGARLVVDGDCRVEADSGRLKQLLENLLSNAVEHGSTGSQNSASSDDAVEHARDGEHATGREEVTVEVGTVPDGFYVADDGPGIPDDERTAVFESGYTTDEDGTGFGLAIVEEIADAHGWDVSVTDSAEGGTRVEIRGVTVLE